MSSIGIVKRIVKDKGFGFIKDERTGQEYFFHKSGCWVRFDSIKEGMKLFYQEEPSDRGPRATNLSSEKVD